MAKGKYASAAKTRRIEELETQVVELTGKNASLKTQIHDLEVERNTLRSKDSSTILAQASALAADDLQRANDEHAAALHVARSQTAQLLMFLVDVLAEVNRGTIGAGQMPGELPGLLHHFSDRPGELLARVVGASDSQDPDVAIMANRANRRANVNSYRTETSRKRERGLTAEQDVLGDPDAWHNRTQGWEKHVRS